MGDVVKLALLTLTVIACQPSSAPAAMTDQSVYNELVDAGCLAASDGGVAAVAAERASPNPAWLNCLYGGGSITGCQVPCTK
jgi:hypothetical protein